MTNEQHIENLKKLKSFHIYNGNYDPDIDRAIKALEQEPCEDAISRQAVVDMAGLSDWFDSSDSYNEFVFALSELPPVTPQLKMGHWIRWYEQKEHDGCIEHMPYCRCSECGKEYDPYSSQFIKFCNECGARMVEPQERSDKE